MHKGCPLFGVSFAYFPVANKKNLCYYDSNGKKEVKEMVEVKDLRVAERISKLNDNEPTYGEYKRGNS